jgi:hypothetical protein
MMMNCPKKEEEPKDKNGKKPRVQKRRDQEKDGVKVLIAAPDPSESMQAKIACSLKKTSDVFDHEEHAAIYNAAYDSAFDISLINSICKRSYNARAIGNYMIYAPKAGTKAADVAIASALLLKKKHMAVKKNQTNKKVFDIRPLVQKHVSKLQLSKICNLVTPELEDLFGTLHMTAMHLMHKEALRKNLY